MDFGNLRIWKSQNFRKSCAPNPSFVLLFLFYNMIILWNHEKSKMRNLLTLILPSEFLQKLGYEFLFDKKTRNELLPISLFSGKVIPITNQHTDSQPCIRLGWARSLIESEHRLKIWQRNRSNYVDGIFVFIPQKNLPI